MKRIILAALLTMLIPLVAGAQDFYDLNGPEYVLVEGTGGVDVSGNPTSTVKTRVFVYLTSADGGFYFTPLQYVDGAWAATVADTAIYVPADLVIPVRGKFDALSIRGETSTEDVQAYIYK